MMRKTFNALVFHYFCNGSTTFLLVIMIWHYSQMSTTTSKVFLASKHLVSLGENYYGPTKCSIRKHNLVWPNRNYPTYIANTREIQYTPFWSPLFHCTHLGSELTYALECQPYKSILHRRMRDQHHHVLNYTSTINTISDLET